MEFQALILFEILDDDFGRDMAMDGLTSSRIGESSFRTSADLADNWPPARQYVEEEEDTEQFQLWGTNLHHETTVTGAFQ